MTTPNFDRPDNIHTALQYNPTTNLPELRVTLGSESITITGDVNVGTTVEVTSTPENPIHTHISEVGTSGILAVPYLPVGILDAQGHVIDNTHPVYVNVTGGSISVDNFPATQTITGTVNIGTMPEVEIKNDAGNPLSVSGTVAVTQSTSPWVISGTVDIGSLTEVEVKNDTGNPLPVSLGNSQQLDAFGRLRVSNPFTLYDGFSRYQDDGDFAEITNGTASSVHDPLSSTITLNVGITSGDSIYRESKKVFAYQPGKSLLVLQSFCMSPGKTGLTQRQGLFDANNGIYIERVGTQANLVLRSSSSGSVQETRIPQASWNNPLPSLNLDLVQLLWMDLEWLGVGTVRVGFVINNEFILVHSFNHANVAGNTTTYMGTACLPLRVELFNTSNTSSVSHYKVICMTVISEGGYQLSGRARSVGHSLGSPKVISSTDGAVPIFSMRLKNTRLGGIVLPTLFNIAVTGNVNYKWYLIEGAVTNGGTWTDAGSTDSSVEYKLDATSYTGGNIINSGYIINSNQSSLSPANQANPFAYQLGRNPFTSTGYEYTILLETTGNNINSWASVIWEEIT